MKSSRVVIFLDFLFFSLICVNDLGLMSTLLHCFCHTVTVDKERRISKMNQEVYRSSENKKKEWSALDPSSRHPVCYDHPETQDAEQLSKIAQLSEEIIMIKDSCDVTVSTTDTKAALSLQASLQAAIAIIINISVADSSKAETITQELLQTAKVKQVTRQKTIIENSRNVQVTTEDTQVAVNIQILLQILLALLVKLNIL